MRVCLYVCVCVYVFRYINLYVGTYVPTVGTYIYARRQNVCARTSTDRHPCVYVHTCNICGMGSSVASEELEFQQNSISKRGLVK